MSFPLGIPPPGYPAVTLAHAFVTSRIDYGNALLASMPRTMKSCSQCRGHTQMFDRDLMHILHDELHSLDVAQRVTFKLCTTVYKCFHALCLSELCVPIADVAGRHQLGSANRGLQYFPRYNMSTYGRRALSYAGRRLTPVTKLSSSPIFPTTVDML